jgi:tetratricopeptide (TPR) repeat protein
MHALFLYQQGRKDSALAELEKLNRGDPEDCETRSRLIALYTELNRTGDAQKLLAAILKHNSRDTDALFQRSVLLLKAGEPRDAEQDKKSVIRVVPNSARAHFVLASVYQAEGLERSRRDELNTALRLEPTMFVARQVLAHSYLVSNHPKSALELLDQTPAAQKSTLGFVIERNWALLRTSDTVQMRAALDDALGVARVPELLLQDGVAKLSAQDYVGGAHGG